MNNLAVTQITQIDQATGAWTRQAWTETLGREVARAKRHNRPLSMLLFEIDQLDAMTKSHGPSAVDELLRGVTIFVKAKIRSYDLLAFMGGGEFALLLPETPGDKAFKLARRLCDIITSINLEIDGGLATSASFGVAALSNQEFTPENLINNAAEALNAAQGAGTAQCSLWPSIRDTIGAARS